MDEKEILEYIFYFVDRFECDNCIYFDETDSECHICDECKEYIEKKQEELK